MTRVFIETTIPSYYFETRPNARVQDWRKQTRLWWDSLRHSYDLVTSPLVLLEFSKSPTFKSARSDAFFDGVALLREPPGVEAVVREYMNHRVMPADAMGDAAHLAFASMHSVDYLLTSNCRHLANANKQRHIRVVNDRLGLPTPIITTPFELVPE